MEKLQLNEIAGYTVQSDGVIINKSNGKKLIYFTDRNGYLRVNIKLSTNKWKQMGVHRIVADCFIHNHDNKPQVNHIDGDKLNNHVSNLEWCTNQENRDHAVSKGLHKHQKFSISKDGIHLGICTSAKDVYEKFGIPKSTVSGIQSKRITHGYLVEKTP